MANAKPGTSTQNLAPKEKNKGGKMPPFPSKVPPKKGPVNNFRKGGRGR